MGESVAEATITNWLKKVGDKVNEGDILAEIETDKATMEFESFHSGTLLYIGLQEGESAKVDTLLAIIGKEGEDISALIGGGAPAPAKAEAAAPAAWRNPISTKHTKMSCYWCCCTCRCRNSNYASLERYYDRRYCSFLVEKSR